MPVLVIAEHDNSSLKPATLSAVTAAKQLDENLHLLIAGTACQSVAEQAAKITAVNKVLVADAPHYEHQIAEEVTPLIVKLAADYSHLLAPATTTGKNLMPRVAALLDTAQISDITAIYSSQTFARLIYAGNAVARVTSSDTQIVLTVRATAFESAEVGEASVAIEAIEASVAVNSTRVISRELTKSERPELTAARVVVSGGRGLGSSDNFAIIETLADKLGAAIGASRAAVDAGYVPNDYQVGQTGKVVAPELYIAVGISGAIQHLAGMKDSKVIVAINKDAEAPIFQIADYGLVANLFEAVPELIDSLPSD